MADFHIKNLPAKYYYLIAGYSLAMPPVCVWLFFHLVSYSDHIPGSVGAIGCGALLSSLAAGIFSLSGIPAGGTKRILWVAIPGIVLSVILGLIAFILLLAVGLGQSS